MTADDVRKLMLLSRQLIENLMSAALCAKEVDAIAQAGVNYHSDGTTATSGNGQNSKPVPFLLADFDMAPFRGPTRSKGAVHRSSAAI